MNKFFVAFCVLLAFGINGCKNNKKLSNETISVIEGSNGSIEIISEARNAIPPQWSEPFAPTQLEQHYVVALDDNDIMEAKKVAEDYYNNITASYKNKIVAIYLDADMNNFLWAIHGYGDDLNPDAEHFPAGNLVVFYVDTTVEGMPARGIALGRENANAQWKVVNEGL